MALLTSLGRGRTARRVVLLLAGLAAHAAAGARGQEVAAGEYAVKAAFLYNFAKFVEWPPEVFPSEGSPLTFCVLGEDPFDGSLDAIVDDETLGQRALIVVKSRSLADPKACHILFVSSSERQRFPAILAGLQGENVLTVGDADGFLAAGGLINFTLESGKVRFEVNGPAVARSPLKVSSKLMRLARVVEPRRPGGGG